MELNLQLLKDVIRDAVKYEILVNYLKNCIKVDDYISIKELTKLLESMEGEENE